MSPTQRRSRLSLFCFHYRTSTSYDNKSYATKEEKVTLPPENTTFCHGPRLSFRRGSLSARRGSCGTPSAEVSRLPLSGPSISPVFSAHHLFFSLAPFPCPSISLPTSFSFFFISLYTPRLHLSCPTSNLYNAEKHSATDCHRQQQTATATTFFQQAHACTLA